MKIRDGFVSNSSSSSFIVCFKDGKPKTLGQLQDLMFGEERAIPGILDNDYGPLAASDVAGCVFDDLKDQVSLTAEEIVEDLSMCIYGEWLVKYAERNPPPSEPKYPPYDYGDEKLSWQERQRLLKVKKYDEDVKRWYKDHSEWSKRMAQAFIDENPGEYYRFHYSDNDGSFEATMEHGDVFRRLPHLRISHH